MTPREAIEAGSMANIIASKIIECRVIDGDSMEMLLDLGHYVRVTVVGRVQNIDAPERGSDAGKAVAEWVRRWITIKPGVQWISHSLDKWRRSLGDVQDIEHPSLTLSTCMLEEKLCRPYSGDARKPWTDEELASITERVRRLMD